VVERLSCGAPPVMLIPLIAPGAVPPVMVRVDVSLPAPEIIDRDTFPTPSGVIEAGLTSVDSFVASPSFS